MSSVKELISHLQRNFKEDDVIAYSIFQVDDINQYNLHKDYFTQEEKKQIISNMHYGQDCNDGLSWSTMETFIDDMINERQNKEN